MMAGKSNDKSNKVTENVDVIDEALKVQESLDGAQDGSPLSLEERDEIQAEISDELAAMANSSESAAIPDESAAMPDSVPTQGGKLAEAKTMAKEIGGMIAGGAAMVFGRDYGVNQTALDKWADSMAPLLVKYDLTDMGQLMSKWGAELQAGAGCLALGAGVYGAHRRYALEDAEAKEAKKKQEEKDHGNQSEQ
ncbi:hypothetical protein Ssed_2195 [Shewanella sediminis HAW-EB3]|uniref:Uncharacterized protein n=1 Tax=Shewanella sediminis (strain HAW-EB3) TaxID=425104 RepID=A8FVD1_SHESH|nr:hypothetical protein [Shewanella sediminis]ABV36804.1 hypothetical protein Ssed_2195 [Shewanella sediminis HAW-EB3]